MEPFQPCHRSERSVGRKVAPVDKDEAVAPVAFTLSAGARRLEMPVGTVSRWARSGLIAFTVDAAGAAVFRPQDLDAVFVAPREPDDGTAE